MSDARPVNIDLGRLTSPLGDGSPLCAFVSAPTLEPTTVPHDEDSVPVFGSEERAAALSNGRAICDYGDWAPNEAQLVGAALMAGALAAGHTPDNAGNEVVALPYPSVPASGDPGYIYFAGADVYTMVNVSDTDGELWFCGDIRIAPEAAWSDGLALVAAARFIARHLDPAPDGSSYPIPSGTGRRRGGLARIARAPRISGLRSPRWKTRQALPPTSEAVA